MTVAQLGSIEERYSIIALFDDICNAMAWRKQWVSFFCFEEDILLRQQWWGIRHAGLKSKVRFISILIKHMSKWSCFFFYPVFFLFFTLSPTTWRSFPCCHLICWCLFFFLPPLIISCCSSFLCDFTCTHYVCLCLAPFYSLWAGEIDGYRTSSQWKTIGSKQQ